MDSENWDWKVFDDRMLEIFNIPSGWSEEERRDLKAETLLEKTLELVQQAYRAQENATARRPSGSWKDSCCCRWSTITGKTISCRWIT